MRWMNLAYLKRLLGVALVCLGLAACGCQHTINPFVDDLPATSEITTASARSFRSANVVASTSQPFRRAYQQVRVEPCDGTVSHWPLWWEDPFEDKGSQDEQFALTAEDYFCLAYGPGRNLLNTMAFPVSVWMTPPATVMCSDGHLSQQKLGYDHDAAPCPGGTSPPIDIIEIGVYSENP